MKEERETIQVDFSDLASVIDEMMSAYKTNTNNTNELNEEVDSVRYIEIDNTNENIHKNLPKKGYSKETFKYGDYQVLKYTDDRNRFDFMKNQFDWLHGAKYNLGIQYSFNSVELFCEPTKSVGYIMDYINNIQEISETDIIPILSGIKKIKNLTSAVQTSEYCVKSIGGQNFNVYCDYIKQIIVKNLDIFHFIDVNKFITVLMNFENIANDAKSYCHGDLTIDNILKHTDDTLNNHPITKYIFIDPNYREDLWCSYLLDISKLYQETYFDNVSLYDKIKIEARKQFILDYDTMLLLDLLLITHYIRMIPYLINRPHIFKIKIEELKQLYKTFVY